jgi:hypothetical protein
MLKAWQRSFAMYPQALGYIGIRAKDLDDWRSYGSGLLGLQRIDKSRSTLAFRMDDRKQRILVAADGGEGIGFFGWEVGHAAALDALAAHLEKVGISVARGSRALADERHVQDLILLNDGVGGSNPSCGTKCSNEINKLLCGSSTTASSPFSGEA